MENEKAKELLIKFLKTNAPLLVEAAEELAELSDTKIDDFAVGLLSEPFLEWVESL